MKKGARYIPMTKLVSWNVNGLRALYKKGAFDRVMQEDPDIVCLQETKATEEQLPLALRAVDGYQAYFVSAEHKKGYSGVALYTKVAPEQVLTGFGVPACDTEGRIIIAEFNTCTLFNIYFPNGKASKERLQYKMDFYDAFLYYIDRHHQEGKHIIVCGDVNTAHQERDLARPKENEKVSGFLPQERAWIDTFLSHGYVDTFRLFCQESGHYTWWDMKSKARERNVGWRIDYFFVSTSCVPYVQHSPIRNDIEGSDHCPVGLDIDIAL